MIKSYKVRLFPNQEQEELMWNHVNACRYVWNWGLDFQIKLRKNNEKYISGYSLKKELTKHKKEEIWLKNISSQSLALSILDLDDAYKRFFKKQTKFPKFKSKKKETPKFPIRADACYYINNSFNIEKIGKIKTKTKMKLPEGRNKIKYINPRIKYLYGKWILSFGLEVENQDKIKLTNDSMGVDLGIKELAVVSKGQETFIFKNINKTKKVKRLKSKLKHMQRVVSRKYHTNNKLKTYDKSWIKSKNILKYEFKIAKLQYKLSNIRKDYTHKITSKLINMLPKCIVIEDLNVSGMMKNRHLSKSIQEQSFYEFRRQIEYKSEWKGIEVVIADRFFPSSKTCSCCGSIKSDLKLKDRVFICNECGFEIDRDINASLNLMNYSEV